MNEESLHELCFFGAEYSNECECKLLGGGLLASALLLFSIANAFVSQIKLPFRIRAIVSQLSLKS
jgi:hypothetical protein